MTHRDFPTLKGLHAMRVTFLRTRTPSPDRDWLGMLPCSGHVCQVEVINHSSSDLTLNYADSRENRNSILVATVGKERIIYTSPTLTQQISNAVPGALRLFVNLLSAGLPIEANVATGGSR
jgi:hypothetical protein